MTRQPHRFSQGAKILRLLGDGEWHTTREILREVPCIVHSRVSELRRSYGWNIEHETTGAGAAGSRYRLLDSPPVWPGGESSGPVSPTGAELTASPAALVSPQPARSEQLTLEAAA